ncbi:hypothetical protein L228DRAFT_280852, partial [Xylona heveae TC161]
MGYRGAWNIIHQGKVYLYISEDEYVCFPEDEGDLVRCVTKFLRDFSKFQKQQNIRPFPLSLQINFSCVYTLDLDHKILKAKSWVDTEDSYKLDVTVFRIADSGKVRLQRVAGEECKAVRLSLPSTVGNYTLSGLHSEGLEQKLSDLLLQSNPIRLFHEQLILDITFQWRSFFGDPDNWSTSWLLQKTLCDAILRVAAWDFRVHEPDAVGEDGELPEVLSIAPSAFPEWSPCTSDIFWFHRFLIVVCEDASNGALGALALDRARIYLKGASATHSMHMARTAFWARLEIC